MDYAKDVANEKVVRSVTHVLFACSKSEHETPSIHMECGSKGRQNSSGSTVGLTNQNDIDLLGNALMNVYDSRTFANDNEILSEVLATRLELDKSQGLEKVFSMMLSYPNNLSLQIGGCRAIQTRVAKECYAGRAS